MKSRKLSFFGNQIEFDQPMLFLKEYVVIILLINNDNSFDITNPLQVVNLALVEPN
jgi:hypothetical protein